MTNREANDLKPFLTHPRVRVEFDIGKNICPVHFADARKPEIALFRIWSAQYSEWDAGTFSEFPLNEKMHAWNLVSKSLTCRGTACCLTVKTSAPHFRLTKSFTLDARHPWLHARYTLVATGKKVRSLAGCLLVPRLQYGPDIEDPWEEDDFDFSFGRVLPGGFERPPYTTLWVRGRDSGVLVWTPTREAMWRMMPKNNCLIGQHPWHEVPHGTSNSSLPWDASMFRKAYTWEFYLWPFLAGEWKAATRQLCSMRFPAWTFDRIAAPPSFKGKTPRAARVYSAAWLARRNPSVVTQQAADRKWWRLRMLDGRSLLYAQDPIGTAPLKIRHELSGLYRIKLMTRSGISLKVGGMRYPVPLVYNSHARMPSTLPHDGDNWTPYRNALLRRPLVGEMDAGVWRLRPGTIELRPFPYMNAQTLLTELRLEPVSGAASPRYPVSAAERRLFGVNDIPDISHYDSTLSDRPFRANIAEHARTGFQVVYWRCDGQCTDFHTRVGTLRPPVRGSDGSFHPQMLSYGYVVRRHDLLKVGVEEAHCHGLSLFGYMRLNGGYGGVVTPAFVREHPELHDEGSDGRKANRICYYLPEVRKWKVEIARESVRHGVDGLLLDLVRHPPMIQYHPAVVAAYREKFGKLPPRDPKQGPMSYGRHALPAGEEWVQWWKFRAEGFTQFGRDIKAMLKEENKPHLPVHVQVRPFMELYDGLDLEAWVDEGLMDLLNVWPGLQNGEPTGIFSTVRNRIPVRGTVAMIGDENLGQALQVLRHPAFSGVTIYESDLTVWTPSGRTALQRLLAETR